MNILITGKTGFIAKNLIEKLGETEHCCLGISHNESDSILRQYCQDADFWVHLAAVQRNESEDAFWEGNVKYTEKIIKFIENSKKKIPVLFTTSTGIFQKSVFAKTKLEAEKIIRDYGKRQHIPIYVFMLNHIFGKYGRPNHNNVIATWCYNLVRKNAIVVNDPSTVLEFTYIDDLINDFLFTLSEGKETYYYYKPQIKYKKSLGEIVFYLGNIMKNYEIEDSFAQKLKLMYEFYMDEFEQDCTI